MLKLLLLSLKSSNNTLTTLYDENLFEFKSRRRLWNTPHLGLLTVGAYLSDQYKVDYIDQNYEEIYNYDYDYVFMSPSTSQVLNAYELSKRFKENGARVVMGGPHVSMLPEEALNYADTVFIGECEETIHEFLCSDKKRIYQADQKPELTHSKIPRYELAAKYPYSSIPIQMSRGCPHQCEFCLSSTIYGKCVRRKTIEQIKLELKTIKQFYQNPFIFITDDNLFINSYFSIQVLKILQSMNLKWYAFSDISVYKNERIMNMLYSSGCRKLLIGFESLDKDNLSMINKSGFKSSNVDRYKVAIQRIQSEKVGVIGSFVLGLVHDDLQTFESLYEFIYDTCLYGTNITIATPFPGTKWFQRISQEQDLDMNWTKYDGFTLIQELPHISKEEFMMQYLALIQKINSKERLTKVLDYFKQQTKQS